VCSQVSDNDDVGRKRSPLSRGGGASGGEKVTSCTIIESHKRGIFLGGEESSFSWRVSQHFLEVRGEAGKGDCERGKLKKTYFLNYGALRGD